MLTYMSNPNFAVKSLSRTQLVHQQQQQTTLNYLLSFSNIVKMQLCVPVLPNAQELKGYFFDIPVFSLVSFVTRGAFIFLLWMILPGTSSVKCK